MGNTDDIPKTKNRDDRHFYQRERMPPKLICTFQNDKDFYRIINVYSGCYSIELKRFDRMNDVRWEEIYFITDQERKEKVMLGVLCRYIELMTTPKEEPTDE